MGGGIGGIRKSRKKVMVGKYDEYKFYKHTILRKKFIYYLRNG